MKELRDNCISNITYVQITQFILESQNGPIPETLRVPPPTPFLTKSQETQTDAVVGPINKTKDKNNSNTRTRPIFYCPNVPNSQHQKPGAGHNRKCPISVPIRKKNPRINNMSSPSPTIPGYIPARSLNWPILNCPLANVQL